MLRTCVLAIGVVLGLGGVSTTVAIGAEPASQTDQVNHAANAKAHAIAGRLMSPF
jgi:hypothetical protein